MIEELNSRRLDATPKGLSVMSNIYVSHAKNAEVWDQTGRRYIDFATGTSTMNVGHSHPKIVRVLHEQIDKFTHTFFQQLPYESYINLAERLNKLVPGNFPKKTALFTDGAGAVENAVKIAKVFTKRSGVISFHGCFHGRTLFTASIAGKVAPYKNNLGTPAGEVYQIPFPSLVDKITLEETKKCLYQLFKHVVDPKNIAAIIIEPVQGEGGFRPASTELFQFVRQTCDQHGIVMVVDEVQSGFGRTGKLFASEHFNIDPDLVVMSKSIAAGIPMSAVTGKAEIMDSTQPGGLGGTYNGNPLGCVSACAVLDIIEEENLLDKSLVLGNIILSKLQPLISEYSQITDIRGIGSMVAIEFETTQLAQQIQKLARDHGLILITAGVNSNVIRFLHPLTIQPELLTEGLDILTNAIREICKK